MMHVQVNKALALSAHFREDLADLFKRYHCQLTWESTTEANIIDLGHINEENTVEKEFTVLVKVSEMDEDTLGTTTRSVMKTVNATTAHQAILKIAKELDRGV